MARKTFLWLCALESSALALFFVTRTLWHNFTINLMAALVAIYAPIITITVLLVGWFQKTFSSFGEIVKFFLALGFFLIGLSMAGWQVFTWLKTGNWVSLPLRRLFLNDHERFGQWLANPHSWYGLHKIVVPVMDLIPLSLLFIALGLSLFYKEPEARRNWDSSTF